MSTEAQKRASKNYYLKHKQYYSDKSNESIKKIRRERKEYKARIDKAIEFIEKAGLSNYEKELYEILIGENDE